MNEQDKIVFSSAAVIFVGLLIDRGIKFGAKVLIARYLGSADYGLIVLGSTSLSLLTYISLLGLDTGVSRYLPRYESVQEKRGVLISALILSTLTSVSIGSVIFFFSGFFATYIFRIPEAAQELRVFAIAIPFVVLMKLSVGMVRGKEKSLPRVYIENMSQPLSRFGLIAIVILLGGSTIDFAWSYTFSFIFTALFSIYFIYKYTCLFDINVHATPKFQSLITFSTPLVVSGIIYRLLTNVDKFLLGYFTKSSGIIGTYDVVYTLSSMLLLVLSAFGYISLPTISKLENNNKVNEIQNIYNMITKWVFILTLPATIVLITFADTIIQITFGTEYTVGAFTFQVLALGFFTHTFAGPNISALQSIGRTKTVLLFNAFVLILNILLNVILIPDYGMLGAGIATIISYLLLNTLSNIQLYSDVRIQPISKDMISIGLSSIVLFLVVFRLAKAVYPSAMIQLITIIIIFVPLYTLIIIKIGISEREMELIRSFTARLF